MIIYTWLIVWAVCWFLSYGLSYAYWTDEFPTKSNDHQIFSFFWSLSGPIGLTVACIHLCNEGYRGFKIR